MLVEILTAEKAGAWSGTLLVVGDPTSMYLYVRAQTREPDGRTWFRTERGDRRALKPDQDLFHWPPGFGHAMAIGPDCPERGTRWASAHFHDSLEPRRADGDSQYQQQLVEFPAAELVRTSDPESGAVLVQPLPVESGSFVTSSDGSVQIGVLDLDYEARHTPFLFLQTSRSRVVLSRRALGSGSEPLRLFYRPKRTGPDLQGVHQDTREGVAACFETFDDGFSVCTAICI
jgi:hypothetical protein